MDILASAPPVEIYVEDSNGDITGANPAGNLDQYGIQDNFQGGIAQIPLSDVSQENNADENGIPDDHTGWDISLVDGGPQNYKIHLKGVAAGATTIFVDASYKSDALRPREVQVPILVSPNDSKEVDVAFDPSENSIQTQRVLSNSDLLFDVQSACQEDLIISRKACEFLTLQAKLIERALNNQHDEEAKAGLWVFLHSLGFSRPFGCRDEDHHDDVKQPALGILQEDAKALLVQEKKSSRHFEGKSR
ncbi:MAG: hypothetical protein ACREL1_00480 [bacterium]